MYPKATNQLIRYRTTWHSWEVSFSSPNFRMKEWGLPWVSLCITYLMCSQVELSRVQLTLQPYTWPYARERRLQHFSSKKHKSKLLKSSVYLSSLTTSWRSFMLFELSKLNYISWQILHWQETCSYCLNYIWNNVKSGLIGILFFIVGDEFWPYFAVMSSNHARYCSASFNYSVLAEM